MAVRQVGGGIRQSLFSGIQDLFYLALSIATRGSANTFVAIVIWMFGAWTSKTAMIEIGIDGPVQMWSILFQGVLTILEGPIWRSHLRSGQGPRVLIGMGALAIDVAMNIGGLWIYLQNLGSTTFWQAVMAVTEQATPPTPRTIFAVCVLLGICVAMAPEALWDL